MKQKQKMVEKQIVEQELSVLMEITLRLEDELNALVIKRE